jgi:aminoglycoside 6-adenylyltransferase
MRTATEIKQLIVDFAKKDDRIKAVLLNGSRANPNTTADDLQDFDIVFIVDALESFTEDHAWTNFFGEIVVKQLPDEMIIGNSHKEFPADFHYLMLFDDGNRIDLTLLPIQEIYPDYKPDSLTVLWLDKAKLFENISPPTDKDYHVLKPSRKEFADICNEFWWVSTYVAKGLLRNEITYAKEMLETVVRPTFMKIIEWKIGAENNFAVSFGKAGKFMIKYLSKPLYKKILSTYTSADKEANWKSLFVMTELFSQISCEVAEKLDFTLDKRQQKKTKKYLKQQYVKQKRRN